MGEEIGSIVGLFVCFLVVMLGRPRGTQSGCSAVSDAVKRRVHAEYSVGRG